MPPRPSLAVTTALKLPAMVSVPVIWPVPTSKLRPGGRPATEKLKASPSTSVNRLATSWLKAAPTLALWATGPVLVIGASLTEATRTVTVATEVAPLASRTV